MGCSCSKGEKYPIKVPGSNTSIYIRTKEGYSIPVKFYNLSKEFTILYCHSASEDFKSACDWVEKTLIPLDLVNVLVFEYFANTDTSEYINESCIYSDCEAILWFFTDTLRLSKRKIILYGKCIGAGVGLFLSERYPDIAGLIMQSSLTYSLRTNYSFKLSFPREFYPTSEVLKKIQCPIMFIHGNSDTVTGMRFIKEYYEVLRNQNKLFVSIEGSHDLESSNVIQYIKDFLGKNDYKMNSNIIT